MQALSSTAPVPVIDLTDSPAKPVPGTTLKSELRKSTLDYMSRISVSCQKRNSPPSSENVVVDLTSDDEVSPEYYQRLKKKKSLVNKNSQICLAL